MAYTLEEISALVARRAETDAAIAGRIDAMSKRSQMQDAQAFRAEFGELGRAVMELATARASVKASGKLPVTFLMCAESAQQATAMPVAQYRAQKLRAAGVYRVVDVTCSIGTEGAAITQACEGAGAGAADKTFYIGMDLDPVRARMAAANVPDGVFGVADATRPAIDASTVDVMIADPARRAGGRRITKPSDLLPPLPALEAAWAGTEYAIKCAPGIDYSEHQGLVSVVSLDGKVRETCLYTPGFGSGREAVVLRGGEVDAITSAMPDDVPVAPAGEYIIDPDGAIVRAGLVRHYAAREGLWMLDEHIAYLTGDRIPAGHSGFKVLEQVGLKRLKSALAARGCGSLEILVRGVDIDPDVLRRKMKLKGSQAYAVVITRLGDERTAFICSPREHGTEPR